MLAGLDSGFGGSQKAHGVSNCHTLWVCVSNAQSVNLNVGISSRPVNQNQNKVSGKMMLFQEDELSSGSSVMDQRL